MIIRKLLLSAIALSMVMQASAATTKNNGKVGLLLLLVALIAQTVEGHDSEFYTHSNVTDHPVLACLSGPFQQNKALELAGTQNPDAGDYLRLGNWYSRSSDPECILYAEEQYYYAAVRGDTDAMEALENMYSQGKGLGLEEGYEFSVRHWRKERGLAFYDRGKRLVESASQAVYHQSSSSEPEGERVEKRSEYRESSRYFEQAFAILSEFGDDHDPQVRHALYVMQVAGWGCDADMEKARKYLPFDLDQQQETQKKKPGKPDRKKKYGNSRKKHIDRRKKAAKKPKNSY